MSEVEKELMAMVFAWLDTLGPGYVVFDIDPSLEAEQMFEIIKCGRFNTDGAL